MIASLPNWSDASPEERGAICETIHRRLINHCRHTETALMHACGFTIETIREALSAMKKRKAVREEIEKGRTYYVAVPRA